MNEGKAIVKAVDADYEIVDSATVMPAMTVAEAIEQLGIIRQVRKELLTSGEDYGKIPGASKPSLFKPGAEKLCNFFGLGSRFECVNSVEEWDKQFEGEKKRGFFYYHYRCTLYRIKDGADVAACEGSCNSREKKYISQDAASIVNTLQKMAQKRAYVGAALIATRASEEYTQDVEDLPRDSVSGGGSSTSNDSGPATHFPFGKQKGVAFKDADEKDLVSIKDWCKEKGAEKFASIIEGVDLELEGRRESAPGHRDDIFPPDDELYPDK